jgi:hypothetical protein
MSTEYPTSVQNTVLSAAHGTFSKIDHILGHKANLSKYKKIEIIPCILSDHNALKLEINNKNSNKKHANNWKLNNTLFNDQWVIDEIKEEIKSSWKLMKMKTQPTRTYGTHKVVLRGKFIAISAYIKRSERSQINDLMLHLKFLEKQEQANPKTSRRREIIKTMVEINEIETNKQKHTKNQ